METVTEILIDFSGSMKDKLSLTKQVLLTDIVPSLNYSSRIGIKTFAKLNNLPPTSQVLNLNITNKEEIIKTINSLGTPNGGTPISDAIRASVSTLKEYAVYDKKIILVTDGEEDAGGDYVAEAKKASADGVNCEIHVIGIGLNDKAQSQAKEISTLTNGSFSHIPFSKGTVYNSSTVKASLSNFYTAAKTTSAVFSNSVAPPLPKKIIEHGIRPQPIEVEKAKVEFETPQTEKTPSIDNNEEFKIIAAEIKNIKEQLLELKANRSEIPDIEENKEQNEKIRKISEEYLFEVLKRKYPNRVKWLNENGESNADHDFEIIDIDNGTIEYYIECKGTIKSKPTFYLTKNEWRLFLNHTKNYQIYFINESFSTPSYIFIDNLLDWLLKGKLVPYLKERDIIKEERVFLTLNEIGS